ncbi:hypothetical protein BHU72_07860 [Desulfuribacillus stibiiarsenatis]|uniref:GlcNAc-PI de-N-acetylase n=1 Tax=Desulfuribacillus stibiiarsenatis TaxID=1390249 RepID=A0A1E5L3M0_9FIRM|nr:PIG-L deacetylase family protein [Desulfuribacillus stibiiarsenatis]OEH84740.1 hypothetical protein BHU72_07860 [Desulfuribacillus stibiiarsenatis]
MNPIKILIIYAHPDDESFGNAGTIAKYTTEKNVEFHIACATRGEAGKLGDPPLTTREELGAYREMEMAQATRILGVKQIHYLDFLDGTLHMLSDTENEQLVKSIVKVILDVKPHIIITFPEDGISLHKDHIAIHFATKAALDIVKNTYTIPKVYYSVVPKSIYHSRGLLDRGVDDQFVTIKEDIDLYRKQKLEALKKYKTQIFSVNKVYPGLLDSNDWSIIPKYEFYQLIRLYGKSVDGSTYHETSILDHLSDYA